MGRVTWRFSDTVRARPDDVYAWMADFAADDHATEAFKRGAAYPEKKWKPSKRTVVSREGNVLRIKDEWGRGGFETTATLDAATRSVRIVGGLGYEATWRATPEGDGTRIEVDGKMGRGLLGSLMKLVAGRSTREGMEKDFRGHVEDLRESLGRK